MRPPDQQGLTGPGELSWSRRELWVRLWRRHAPSAVEVERPSGPVTGRPSRLRLERAQTATDREERP